MTQLETIKHNRMGLECVYGHGSMISVAELLKTLKPETTIYQVAGAVRCNRFRRKGAADFKLHYVRQSKDGPQFATWISFIN